MNIKKKPKNEWLRFKHVNDTYGYLAGDAVLLQASQRMGAVLRAYDTLGRYGGEEFLIVLPGCALASALDVAERLRHCIAAAPVMTLAGAIPISISLGAATTGGGYSLDSDGLLQVADAALYRAKLGGRNCVEAALHGETVP